MKLLIISAFALCLSLEAFALPAPGKAPVAEPTLKTEDLLILQNRPAVKRYNVQTQGWALKVEETNPAKPSAKTTEGAKTL
jgi:hypothetical protein